MAQTMRHMSTVDSQNQDFHLIQLTIDDGITYDIFSYFL